MELCLFDAQRLKKFKDIVNLITTQPSKIPGLSNQQKASLIGLKLTIGEWEFVECILYVLAPFYQATKMLSGRQYPTLSLAFVIQKMLHNFLKSDREKEDSVNVFHLKQVILTSFEYHLIDKISNSQKNVTLVMFKYLNI